MTYKLTLFVVSILIGKMSSLECLKSKETGNACICLTSQGNCQEAIPQVPDLGFDEAVVYETAKSSSERLSFSKIKVSTETASKKASKFKGFVFTVDVSTTHQEILGFGGAMTDSTFINLGKLPASGRDEILEFYYGKKGLEYTMGRVPIGSTGSSLGVYSYNETKDDFEMRDFSIDLDRSATTGDKVSFIKKIKGMFEGSGKVLRLFASPWSPPTWMTDNGTAVNNPKLIDTPEIKNSYTLYLQRFFEEYEKEGISFWGMTAQNEPAGNFGKWQSLKFTPEEQRDFIRDYLGPRIKTAYPDLKIMMLDDQR